MGQLAYRKAGKSRFFIAPPLLKLVTPATISGTVPPRRKPNVEVRPREYLTEGEVEKLRKAAGDNRHGHRNATMVLVAYRHGLRATELVRLQWDNVDFEQAKLHVNRAKNGSPSVHPLAGVELRALRRLKRESPETPFVFVSERGSPFSAAGFRKMVARLGAAAGFNYAVHPHMLRQPVATSSPMTASTPGRCSTTWATRTSSTPCATPSCRRIGSRASGRID
jgi:type 1 fimbriae regulatory protein FimB/type 1 fimbriae regulatory protein FimE